MTRDEMEELKGLAASMGLYDDKNPCKRAVILGKAIKALEQQTCEDAVSREDALMALTGEWTEPTDELIHRFFRRIRNLPSVNPQRTGHWINEGIYAEGHSEKYYRCSECDGHIIEYEPDDFCKYCGAKMEG